MVNSRRSANKDTIMKEFLSIVLVVLPVLQCIAAVIGITANAEKAVSNYKKYKPIVKEKVLKYKKAFEDYILHLIKK